ncbi:hypothetical protein AR457_14805 [Streptomyces agglomeratus]|uniref:Uncharacterized protein n=1 Tax=Streptomyces agglomeratus TaxID=285458 RepID=A0A1E5P7V2_9ACTN|nr:hypothetical protein AS594_14620 [Streptomyces agglomeratus]OEJ40415.1 hypothetical protein BGK70_21850 [Streptomyces agglomeratus]OEJ45207.1 hypothetical protein AR457_14805 [Streptomyces agglomeratus]OEJ52966.1 hypothetical protein BGK72_21490 [Streptomyces agglomeratus]
MTDPTDTTDATASSDDPTADRTRAHLEHPMTKPATDGTGAVRDAALWAEMLIRQFPELLTELATGRRSSVENPHHPGAAELSARSARIREERQEALLNEQRHGLAVPGHSAAPVRLHVSDAIRDITDGVVELEEAVFDRLALGRPRRDSVPRRLLRLTALLGSVAEDPVLAGHVRDEVRRMARRCARALGEAETMVRVRGRCPWCESVSMRAFPERRAVLCVNPACRCADADCDCATDPAFRHIWAEGAWPELARLGGVDTQEIAARMSDDAPEGVRPDGVRPDGIRLGLRGSAAAPALDGERL